VPRERLTLIGLLLLQIIALVLYPLTFFRSDPQSAVLPPTLLILLALALLGMNTGALTPLAGRVSLVFVQGVNIVVRMMMFPPNLRTASGTWDWLLIIFMLIGIACSWLVIIQLEKRPPRSLLIKQKGTE
jgi:hypothetical protein